MNRIATCALVALALNACKRSKDTDTPRPFRLGFLQNVTHAQALVGTHSGAFREALSPTGIDIKQFNAGPAAMEALLAGELDASFVGPGPATTAFVRSSGALRVVSGASSGGAVLVTAGIRSPEELKGKRVAVPQLGNTQDIALRHWLTTKGLAIGGGDDQVKITPIANPDIMNLFKQGELVAAWVPEPWGARLIAEAGAKILVNESELWEGGKFPTTVLVATKKALEHRRGEVEKLVRAHVALTHQARSNPDVFLKRVNEAFGAVTGKPMSEPILRDAFSRIEFTTDPLEAQLREGAKHAHGLGYLPKADVAGLVDGSVLSAVSGVSGVSAPVSSP